MLPTRRPLVACVLLALSALSFACASSGPSGAAARGPSGLLEGAAASGPELKGAARVRADAVRLLPVFRSRAAREFLGAAEHLPEPSARTLYLDRAARAWSTREERDELPEAARAALEERVLDADYYYNTRYGSPLAYARAIELIASRAPRAAGFAGGRAFQGKRILDYGYGTIGHLRLMASLGAHVVGVDTDTSLERLYRDPVSPPGGDVGRIAGVEGSEDGSIRLRTGRFPVDPDCTPVTLLNSVGTPNIIDGGVTIEMYQPVPYDLFLSKNTLKNGYINPSPPDGKPVDKRMLVDLGTDAPGYLAAVHEILKPGGLFMIYNISPGPSKPGEAYKPWSDGRCPFTREQLEAAGFEVIAFDEPDDAAARRMARLLGWADDPDGDGPRTGMDVEKDMFTLWTLARRR